MPANSVEFGDLADKQVGRNLMEIGPLQKDAQNIAIAPVSTTPEVVAQNRELIQAVKSVCHRPPN